MPKYIIFFEVQDGISVEVEADSLEAAQEGAWDELPGGICAQCSGWGQAWSRDEGEPMLNESQHIVDGEFVEDDA